MKTIDFKALVLLVLKIVIPKGSEIKISGLFIKYIEDKQFKRSKEKQKQGLFLILGSKNKWPQNAATVGVNIN